MSALSWRARLAAYGEHPDPLAAAANLVSLVITGNQPFYPIFAMMAAGWAAWPSLTALVVMPLFGVVPWLMRRSTLLGRIWLVVVSIANCVLCAKTLGQAVGVELFLIPSATLAVLFFRKPERPVMLVLVGLAAAAYFLMQGRYGAPIAHFTEAQTAALFTLHAGSVASLTGFFGLILSGLLPAAPPKATGG